MLVVINPSGPVHFVVTVTGISDTSELNSTVQVIVTVDPTGRMIPGLEVDKITEVGAGTAWV